MSCGALDVLISDNACATTSQKVKDILHMYHIKSCTCEPHHQHQNYAKYCIGHIKDIMNHIFTFTSAPSNPWLLCLMYVVYILNITPNNSIGNMSPHQYLYVKPLIFPPHFVFASMNQSTTWILIHFLPLLRKWEMGWFCPQCQGYSHLLNPYR